jgi:predicted phosphodiesterase
MIATCRVALFGGIYNNYLALDAAIRDAHARSVDAIYCLGDLGAFGPHPDRVFPLLDEHGIVCIQGNYDDSIGNQLDNCQCGYTDPRDNYFAQVSYGYTLSNTASANRLFLQGLPKQRRIEIGAWKVLLCHGSPRRVNEFLWESTTPTHFLDELAARQEVDVIAATHTGIKWQRRLSGGGLFVNVGVLGRPENDGRTNVWYALLESTSQGPRAEFIPVEYDHRRLACEMQAERLPPEFVETIVSGWWTTCLEILPAKGRRRGRF